MKVRGKLILNYGVVNTPVDPVQDLYLLLHSVLFLFSEVIIVTLIYIF